MILGDDSLTLDGSVGAVSSLAARSALLLDPPDPLLVWPGAPVYGPADVWGGITVPTQPSPSAHAAGGDPALTTMLEFLRTALVTDGLATAAWTQAGVAPGYPAIKGIHAHNPSDSMGDRQGQGFNTSDLPALYAWRADPQSTLEYIADDVLVDTSMVRMLWVFPETIQANQRKRAPFANALAKCIVNAIEHGFTPSFRVAGDPAPTAPVFGSLLYTAMNAMALNVLSWRQALVEVKDGPRSYPAIEFSIELKENQELNPLRGTEPMGLELTLNEVSDDVDDGVG